MCVGGIGIGDLGCENGPKNQVSGKQGHQGSGSYKQGLGRMRIMPRSIIAQATEYVMNWRYTGCR
jgi:hypothetical protein